MTARVINDPAALGWEFDPSTGRWNWGGSGSGSGGGGDVDLSDYVKSTERNYVSEGDFQLVWDDSSDPNYPFNGRIGYNSQSTDPNSLDGSFLYINGTRGTFSIGRDGDVELHGASEILGVEDRLTGDRPWITGFSYVQAADFLDADGNSIIGSGGGGGIEGFEVTNDQAKYDLRFGWNINDGPEPSPPLARDIANRRKPRSGERLSTIAGQNIFLDADANADNAVLQNIFGTFISLHGPSEFCTLFGDHDITGGENVSFGASNVTGNLNTVVGVGAIVEGDNNVTIGKNGDFNGMPAARGNDNVVIGDASGVKRSDAAVVIGKKVNVEDCDNIVVFGRESLVRNSQDTVHIGTRLKKMDLVVSGDLLDTNGNPIVGGGGGGGNDPRITDTQITNWDTAYGWGNHASQGYLTSASLSGYATQTWVGQNYQPKGNYSTTSHNHNGVYAPVSHTHNYAAVGASYTKAESDARYEAKGAGGGGFDGNYSSSNPAKFTMTAGDGSAFWVYAPSSARGAEIRLQAGSNSQYFRCGLSGNFEIVNSAYSAVTFQCTNGGDVIASGDVTANSDARLKENVETLDGSKVYEMRGVSFTKDGRDGSGVIAQELAEVAPELVNHGGEYLSVAYGNLVGYLIEAVKDLKAEVEELKRGQ